MKPRNWKDNNGINKDMKRLIYIFAAMLILGVSGCKEQKKPTPKLWNDLEDDSVEMEDTTLYGVCGDGTAMNSLELITNQGDTLTMGLGEEDDTISCVKGGLSVGDRLAVIVRKGSGDEWDRASLVVNLTTLLGKWSALDKTFELQEGGVVVSTVVEPHPLTEWKIFNGHLVLSTDTFDIYELGADSLYLENKKGIFAYKRMK